MIEYSGKDWFRLLADLQKAGLNNSEVARKLNVPRWRVQDWKDGKEPTWTEGDKLITLHAISCPYLAVQLPRVSSIEL